MNRPKNIQPADIRHGHVEQSNVGLTIADQRKRLRTACCRTDNLKIRCGAQNILQAAQKEGMVIRQQHGMHQRSSVSRGKRSEEHTSELQSLMRISYAVFCLKKKKYIRNKYNYIYNDSRTTSNDNQHIT